MSMKKLAALVLSVLLLCSCLLSACKDPNDPEVLAQKAVSTVALTIGDHSLNAVELNYYYVEMINTFWNQYSNFISYILDLSKPLNEQIFDEKTQQTWADYFLECSIQNALGTYALCNLAVKDGLTLTDAQRKDVDDMVSTLDYYAKYYGFADTDAYLTDLFGHGATLETYRTYYENNLLANAYYDHYFEGLQYEDTAIRTYESGKEYLYNSYTFAVYYLAASKFLTGGTEGEDGKVTYTDEQKKAALDACKAAADALAAGSYADVKAFNEALAALEVNQDLDSVKATEYNSVVYGKISDIYTEWIADETRVDGELGVIAATTGSGDSATTEGYYIIRLQNKNDNTCLLKNVRHILVLPEGGTYNSTTGAYDYTDSAWKEAKKAAELLLKDWQFTDMTEDSFAALANKESDDLGGNVTNGGLYENIYPGQMVSAFNDWCFDESRKAGDYDIIKTEYGYHIMYFVGNASHTYRDYMILTEMRNADTTAWFEALVGQYTVTEKDLSFVELDMILYPNT